MTKSACLEIHQINVSQGDSVLIINRDLDAVGQRLRKADLSLPSDRIDYLPLAIERKVKLLGTVSRALLIDGGDDEYGGDVYGYLIQHGVIDKDAKFQPKLMVLVSHYHDDHQAGLRYIFKERVPPARPGEKATYKPRTRPAVIYQAQLDGKTDSTSVAGTRFQEDIMDASLTWAPSQPRTRVELVRPGGRDQNNDMVTISLGVANGLDINVYLLASSQYVYNEARQALVQIPSRRSEVDQNDRSLVAVLQYGSFRFFMGGDIGGDGGAAGGNTRTNAMGAKHPWSVHADVESVVRPALKAFLPATRKWTSGKPKFGSAGYCTVMKADHHGSNSSNDVYLLSTIRPLLFLISSGFKPLPHGHPTQQVIDRASATATPSWGMPGRGAGQVPNTIKQIYITEVAAKVDGTAFPLNLREARIVGDIVVRPVDETVVAVQDAAAEGTELTVQVYGTGETTRLVDPLDELRPTTSIQTDPSKTYYPIGPWEHSDVH